MKEIPFTETFTPPEAVLPLLKQRKYPEPAYIIYLASLLATSFQAGTDIETANAKELGARLQRIGLTAKELPAVISGVPWEKWI